MRPAQSSNDRTNRLAAEKEKTSFLSRDFFGNGSLAVKKRPFVGDKEEAGFFQNSTRTDQALADGAVRFRARLCVAPLSKKVDMLHVSSDVDLEIFI